MKIVYFGTPDFASIILKKLSSDNYFEIIKVITACDKKTGRKMELSAPDVKICATNLGLSVYQTDSCKNDTNVDEIIKDADLCVVASFGQIIPKRLLDKKRFINVHASILPKYRGASPIQSAILNGDKETGVSIMDMDEDLDTGDILAIEKIKIEDDDTAETLFNKLAYLGSDTLIKTLKNLDNIQKVKQSDTGIKPIITKKIHKEDAFIDPSKISAKKADLIIRGMYSWPIAYINLGGKKLQIHKAYVVPDEQVNKIEGEIKNNISKDFYLKFKEGILRLDKVKPEGKNLMDGKAFLLGYRK